LEHRRRPLFEHIHDGLDACGLSNLHVSKVIVLRNNA
jgi:hypothetical protein